MTSATPSTDAASRSSVTRTAPRSPSGTSAGSLIDPDSPREPQSSTTRAPASASRASVPPHASDSSSGCAKTASTVRPAAALSGTVRLHDAPVNGEVFVGHPPGAEPGDRALANDAAIEIEDAGQLVCHLLEILVHDSGDTVVDDFAHGAFVERGDGRSACHRL